MKFLVIITLVAAFCLGAPTFAHADGQADEAELQFQLGAEAYTAGDYRGALKHFLASNRLVPNRNVVFNIARVYEQLGRFPESYRYYVDAKHGETDAAIVAEIDQALKRLGPEVAVVDVRTKPDGATIYVDEKDLGSVGTTPRPLAFPAGEVRIIVEKDGYETRATEVLKLQKGRTETVNLDLTLIVGTLVITGDDGTEVRLDTAAGDAVCAIPCTVDAPPGPHTVFLTRSGRADTQRQVIIEAQKTVELEVRLEALTGSLLVQADEREALVEVDGRPSGFTPAIIPDVPIGRRKIRVSLSGYRAVEREVEVRQGEQTLVNDIRLVPLREVAAASRSTEAIEDAPASITVISRQELEAFQYPTIFEALRGVRGFSMTFDSIYGNSNIRGLGLPNDYNNRMLILADGAALNDNISGGASILYDNRSDLHDVDHIEIVRGPGSVVYGTGAVAGVVNVVPFGRDEPTEAEFSAGTADTGVARGRVMGNWRASPTAGARASLSAARSDGYDGVMVFDADGDGTDDRNIAEGIESFESWSTVGRGWLGPLTLQWQYSSRRIRIPTGSFDTTFNDPRNYYEDTLGLVELRLEQPLGEKSDLLVRVHGDMYKFHLDYFYEYEEEDPDTGEITFYDAPYFEDYLSFWGGAEARLTFRPVDGLRIGAGAETVIHPSTHIGGSELDDDGNEVALLDINPTFRVYAAYLLLDWRLSKVLALSLGTRLDIYDRDQADSLTSVNPRAAVIIKPNPKHNIKLMGGRSFRAPSPYETFYEDNGSTTLPSNCCGSDLRPETFYQSEIEYTYRFDDDWSAIASAHGLLAQDFIGTLPAPAAEDEGLVYFANTDDQLYAGVETEFRREFRGGWMFAASGGYLTARFLDPPTAEGATPDLRSPNAPYVFGTLKSVVPAIPNRLALASRFTLEGPRRASITSDLETDPAVIADLILTGRIEEFGIRYSFGVYNLFDWKLDLPVDPFPSLTMPQRPRSLLANISLTL